MTRGAVVTSSDGGTAVVHEGTSRRRSLTGMARRRINPADGVHAVRTWAGVLSACGNAQPGDGVPGVNQAAPAQHGAAAGAEASTGVGPCGTGERDARARRQILATAVRYTLEELAAVAPGRSVEVRVPPYGAAQAVAGTVHRRGTPPSVVEADAATWLALATGRVSWERALESGALHASGERCDLSAYLPLLELENGGDAAGA